MRIDLPCCGFKNCQHCFDGNCTKPSEQEKCEYWYLLHKDLYGTQSHWIPCSERLPETEALCCDTRGEMIIGYLYSDEESYTGYSAESDDVFLIGCIAWMPLPEPYKEEGEN